METIESDRYILIGLELHAITFHNLYDIAAYVPNQQTHKTWDTEHDIAQSLTYGSIWCGLNYIVTLKYTLHHVIFGLY